MGRGASTNSIPEYEDARFLLVIGDAATLGGHPYYAGFLDAVERHGLYVSAYADEAPPL